MKKIMFADKFRLTEAVLEGRKTMTRRTIKCPKKATYLRVSTNKAGNWWSLTIHDGLDNQIGVLAPHYKIGEIVAIAQPYKDIPPYNEDPEYADFSDLAVGWNNKMFVSAGRMKHHIKITNIKVERLQACSNDDCLREGIMRCNLNKKFTFDGKNAYDTPREAFAALIDKVSGKGVWQSNPYVFCYEFELVD